VIGSGTLFKGMPGIARSNPCVWQRESFVMSPTFFELQGASSCENVHGTRKFALLVKNV